MNKMEGPTSKKTKKSTQEGEPQREHQVPKPRLAKRSISNKEREGPPERTRSLRSISNKESGGLHERTPSLRSISNKESGGLPERTPSLRSIIK
jgi:hypothetical protein